MEGKWKKTYATLHVINKGISSSWEIFLLAKILSNMRVSFFSSSVTNRMIQFWQVCKFNQHMATGVKMNGVFFSRRKKSNISPSARIFRQKSFFLRALKQEMSIDTVCPLFSGQHNAGAQHCVSACHGLAYFYCLLFGIWLLTGRGNERRMTGLTKKVCNNVSLLTREGEAVSQRGGEWGRGKGLYRVPKGSSSSSGGKGRGRGKASKLSVFLVLRIRIIWDIFRIIIRIFGITTHALTLLRKRVAKQKISLKLT